MAKLLVKTSGNLDGKESLLVLHGWGMNSQAWESVRVPLESAFQVIWVDLPGHGFNHEVKARDMNEIAELIIRKMPQKCHIMAWSLGGLIAQSMAQRVPQKIKSMTLVASTPKFTQSMENNENKWQHAMSNEVLNNFAAGLKNDSVTTLKKFVALQFMGIKDTKTIQRDLIQKIIEPGKSLEKWRGVHLELSIHNDSAMPDTEALDLGLNILKHADFRDFKSTISEHWIFGGRDRLIPVDVIKDLKSIRPDAQITLLENAGHAPFMTHPDKFIEHLMHFIDAHH